jgi:glutamate-5-semialdehyde dehydrogenase
MNKSGMCYAFSIPLSVWKEYPVSTHAANTTVEPNQNGFEMQTVLQKAKQAFQHMATLTMAQKNEALNTLATLLETHAEALYAANAKDLEENRDTLEPALYSRLKLDAGKMYALIEGIRQVAKLEDPVGQVLATTELDTGLILKKVSVPLGLIGIIFESRPDVLPQVLSLILKSGNAVVFKGGRESLHTLRAMMQYVVHPLRERLPFLPEGWAVLLESREAVQAMLNFPQYVDLVIPRGSNAMVKHIMDSTRIPVLGHADGVCHQYIHASANLVLALDVIIDSKIQYPSACNALETLLVDMAIAPDILPLLSARAIQEGITLRACERSIQLLPYAEAATEDDWHTEYGNLTLTVKCVDNLEDAIVHINHYSSHHTDGILAEDETVKHRFLTSIDSASVFANVSTRFADGFRYGFGAEIGISTARTHARGPVGLDGLISYKFLLEGQHHQVKDYTGNPPARAFTHRILS